MKDYRIEPEYVYQTDPPNVEEMVCPEEQFISCLKWMNREEMLTHYQEVHAEYGATNVGDIEVLFEAERERRFPL